MLYYRALVGGLDALPQADAALRAQIDADAARRGWPALHADLAKVDPQTAARLPPNDSQRIQRALEVFRLSGRPLSALQGARMPAAAEYQFVPVALVPAVRSVLHQRIERRFDAMLAAGLVQELEWLRGKYALTPELPAMRCVGYRQAWEHLDGAYDFATLRDRGIYATRQLAKRQLTWLRAMPEPKIFDCLAPDPGAGVVDYLARRIQRS